MLKKFINKDNLKTVATSVAKEGAQIGVDVVTEGARGFIAGIFYKIIFIIILVVTLLTAGCVGSQIIVDKFSNTPNTNITKELKTLDK